MRELTDNENKAVALVKMFEQAADARQPAVHLTGSLDAAMLVMRIETKFKGCKVLKVQYDGQIDKYRITMTLPEFYKYYRFILDQMGIAEQIDGALITKDNVLIPYDSK